MGFSRLALATASFAAIAAAQTTTGNNSSQTTLAVSTTFTPPATCTQQHFTILERLQYQIWLNHPLPVSESPMPACYPSQVYSSLGRDGELAVGSITASASLPAISPLVCPQGYGTVLQATGGYIACCPSSFLLANPPTTLASSRPAFGGTCYSPITNQIIVTAYDNSSVTATATWSPSVSGAQIYAYVIDGFAASTTPLAVPTATDSSSVTSAATSTTSSATGAQSTAPITQNSESSGLSGGAIAGIVIGVLAGVALLLAVAFMVMRRRRRSTAGARQTLDTEKPDLSYGQSRPPPPAMEMMADKGAHEMDTPVKLSEMESPAAELDGEEVMGRLRY